MCKIKKIKIKSETERLNVDIPECPCRGPRVLWARQGRVDGAFPRTSTFHFKQTAFGEKIKFFEEKNYFIFFLYVYNTQSLVISWRRFCQNFDNRLTFETKSRL